MSYKICSKIWLEGQGKVFGDGPCRLLQGIKNTGSLRRSAAEMNMSYAQAWNLIRMLEKNLGFPLLIRQVGGSDGGGSTLSPEGEELLKHYTELRRDIDRYLEILFNKHFPGS